jgi:dTDP-4-amino-4,6-dideoxygalactose transaminase
MNGKRDDLANHLAEKHIPFGIYYPIPLHRQKAYVDKRNNESDFPVTNELIKEVISLPMHTELEDDQISFVSDTIIQFLQN